MNLTAAEAARYSRHLLLAEVGGEGQQKLRAARVLVIGAGGLGSPATLYLAASGVGTIGVADCDCLELSNLQRQILFTTADLGEPKAVAARERLLALNPEIQIVAHTELVSAKNVSALVGAYDVVIDGSDRVGTRYVVNDACVLLRRPLVSAAIHRFEGQATTVQPGVGPCYRCLFPDAGAAAIPNCAEAGVLGVLPGVLGTIQATEAIKLILGIGEPLVGRLLTYDALEMSFREFRFERRRDCAVCGETPTIAAPRDEESVPAPTLLSPDVRILTPHELHAVLARSDADGTRVELIDVREPHEFAAGHIDGARSIPLDSLETSLDDIGGDVTLVFMCRSGGRSARACAVALERGRGGVANLKGGLAAWVADIDSSIRVA